MKWASTLKVILFLNMLMGVILFGCNDSSLSNQSSQDYLGNANFYLTSNSSVRIYYRSTGIGQFITLLSPSKGKVTLPVSAQFGDYGYRDDNSSPRLLNLFGTIYKPDHLTGDFYFESPVLGPSFTITNVTTALSWFLQWNFGNQKVRISKKTFDQIILSIEVVCKECRQKTNAEVLSLIRSDSHLVDEIVSLIRPENPSLSLAINWSPPVNPQFAWSDPLMSLNGISLNDSGETKLISPWALFIEPENSTHPIKPESWIHSFQTIDTSIDSSNLNYTFSYDERGDHSFKPIFLFGSNPIDFQYSVGNLNRPPICESPLNFTMQANRTTTVSLTDHCGDPDVDETSIGFSLLSGPYGLTVNSSGSLKWLPSQDPAHPNYSKQVSFSVNDSELGLISSSATINVIPDNSPHFDSLNLSYNFIEGTEGVFFVSASDQDGDPINLRIEKIGPLSNGFPDGAGSLSNIIRSGSNGTYTYEVRFTPSFLQTIGADGSTTVKFLLVYENINGLDTSLVFDEQTVIFNFSNVDDPPIWNTQPLDMSATEAVDFGSPIVGLATDPAPNSTSITYTLVNKGESYCNWGSTASMSTDGGGNAILNGSPPYFASEECIFSIRATDVNNLNSESANFTITTANVNQPIVLLGSPLASIVGQEGKTLVLPLDQMFQDPDLLSDPIDEREYLTYDCLVDSDSNGSYESTCLSLSMNIQFSPTSLLGVWTPPPFSANLYKVRLSVTDIGGVMVSNDFTLDIQQYATPMVFSTLYGGSPVADLSIYENSSSILVLRAASASGRPIDNYAFNLNAPTCTVLSGSGGCSASIIISPGTLGGNGTSDILFTLSPDFTAGDRPLPDSSRTYLIGFYGYKSDDPTVYMQHSVTITVNNLNRLPTSINMQNSGSFGCPGSAPNSDSGAFTVCIDLSKDNKVGNYWSKKYSINMAPLDADTTNDIFGFSLPDSLTPGSIQDVVLTFQLPGCVNASNGTVLRTYPLRISDGRGGYFDRDITLKIIKAVATPTCL